jgi:hypothetical protein
MIKAGELSGRSRSGSRAASVETMGSEEVTCFAW